MYCVYNSQTDEARHTISKLLADKLFDKINSGYMSEIVDGKEKILCEK